MVAPSEHQLNILAETTVNIVGDAHCRYWFILEEDVHPLRIQHARQRIAEIRWEQVLLDGNQADCGVVRAALATGSDV